MLPLESPNRRPLRHLEAVVRLEVYPLDDKRIPMRPQVTTQHWSKQRNYADMIGQPRAGFYFACA